MNIDWKILYYDGACRKARPMGHPLFPGYRLLPHADKAMSSLTSRIFSSNDYLELVASVMGLKGLC